MDKRGLERIIGLPFGQIDEWKKTGEYPKEYIALMSILTCFPWMIAVMEDGFDPESAEEVSKWVFLSQVFEGLVMWRGFLTEC